MGNNIESISEEIAQLDVHSLHRFGIPTKVLEAIVFEHGGDPRLLKLQAKGILAGVCDPHRLLNSNGIISGPTGSGKTFLAEMRMLARYFEDKKSNAERKPRVDEGRGKTIYLVPMRAIGLEKLGYLSGLYGQFGIKVLYSDGDFRIHDGDILRGKFDVAIIVNEKLRFFLLHNREFFKTAGEVVIDEIGLISDKVRGPNLEITLTGLLSCPHKPIIIALATPLEGARHLAESLDGFLIEDETRPIDIRTGIWSIYDGQLHSWSHNTLQAYPLERMGLEHPTDKEKILKELVLRYRSGIMFALPSKDLVHRYAGYLYDLATADAAVRDMMLGQTNSALLEQRLKGLEATRNKEALLKHLRSGIGFHHADLTSDERKEVESAFRNGEIPIVFCTSTLARGVNLPAQTVVFLDWGDTYTVGDRTCPRHKQLAQEFPSWVGRAGRLNMHIHGTSSAIYVAQTRSERRWIEGLIHMKRVGLSAHLADNEFETGDVVLSATSWLLNRTAPASGLEPVRSSDRTFDLDELENFFRRTLSVGDRLSDFGISYKLAAALVRLANPQGGQAFIRLTQLIHRAKNSAEARQKADLNISQAELPAFLLALEDLEEVGKGAADVVERLKNTLIKSLEKRCYCMTLRELRQILDEIHTAKTIDWMMAVLGMLDTRYLAMSLDDLYKSLETDIRLDILLPLKPKVDSLRRRISNLVLRQFQDVREKKSLGILRAIKRCNIESQQATELRSLLNDEKVLKFFLQRAYNTVSGKSKMPTYLRLVEDNQKIIFQLTPFGKICCSNGISTSTCDQLYSWALTIVEHQRRTEFKVVEILDFLLGTSDGRKINLLRSSLPVVEALKAHTEEKHQTLRQPTSKRDVVTVLAVADWMTGMPTIEIERKYGLYAGSLHEVSKQISRLVKAFADISQEVFSHLAGYSEREQGPTMTSGTIRIPGDLDDLAETILHGLPSEALPIAHLGVEGLSRGWVMELFRGLGADERQSLPIVEHLQNTSEDRLKEMLPTRGLTKRLIERLRDHGKTELAANLVDRQDFLVAYYMLPQVVKAQLDRSRPHYGTHTRNTAVRIMTADHRHVVLRRNDPITNSPMRIESEQDIIKWVRRGAIDFYGEPGEEVHRNGDVDMRSRNEEPRFVIDRFFVDLDPQNDYPMEKLKMVAKRIHALFSRLPQVETVKIYWSGGKGFHIIALFRETVFLDIKTAKQKLRDLLISQGICNDTEVFLEKDAANLDPHLVVDLASVMQRGLYRNEFSIHAVSGGCCVEVKIDKLADFNPAIEATPEAVKRRLLDELTNEEKDDYTGRVAREFENGLFPRDGC